MQLHHFQQFDFTNWFRNVIVESGLQGLIAVACKSIGSLCNDNKLFVKLPDESGGFVSIHFWHAYIHQHQIDIGIITALLNSFDPVVSLQQLGAKAFEQVID